MADKAVMTIRWTQDGQITVENFPPDTVAAYGMLEVARDAIHDFFKKQTPTTNLTIAHGKLPLNGHN